MLKKLLILFVIPILIISCKGNDIVEEVPKKDFIIEVNSFGDFSKNTSLNKTGKISSSQDLTVSSNAIGRIKNLFVKSGDFVNKGDILAVLEDNIANYQINLEKARNGLDRASINHDSTKINLDKQVFDAELSLKKLENNLIALKNDTSENIRKAETDLTNANIENIDSKSALELQKINNSINKAELDYNTKIASDNETIESFYNTIKKEYSAQLIFLDDIIEFSDEILGVTDINKDENDAIESFLGAKNISQRDASEDYLKEIIAFRKGEFSNININLVNTNEKVIEILNILDKGYSHSRDLLNSLEETFNNSVSSEGTLSSNDISTYIATINGYQSTMQLNYSTFLAFDNNAKSFLRTYKNNQDSIKKSIELLKKDKEILEKSLSIGGESAEVGYNKTIINSNDAINTLELQVESAKNTLENAKKTREVTLRSLKNTINEANIAYQQALREYNKLTIKSPISGVIGDVLVDLGQEIGNGTPVFNITNNSDNEVTISFNKKELNFVSEGKEAFLEFDGQKFSGVIYSISKTADENLKYVSKIKFRDNINLTGNIVSISIPIEVKNILLPINIIKINDSGVGTINILNENNKIEQIDVKLGNIYGNKIEVLDNLPSETKIILSYIDNFDEEKFKLKIK